MPQAVAAAAAWVGNAIATAVITATGHIAFSSSIAFITISTVSQAALVAGLSYVIDDVSRQKVAPQGQELQLRVDSDMAREMLIGERVVAGSLVARYSRGSNLYNAHFVYQLADHPCTELSKVYGDGRLVRSTALPHGTRTEITAYSYSGGARVWMTWHDGRPGQTVDSDLVTKSAQDPDVVAGQIVGWSSSHIGAGCAYVHIEVQYDSDILTSIPQFLFHVKGAPLYDRRLDTTAGGSGSHRIDDPSTWAYSTNAAVANDHYMLGYKVEDDDLAFGIGLRKSEVPYEQFAAAADLADEDVVTGVGGGEETIKRYAVNAVISSAELFEDVLIAMQNQMAARIVDLGGRIGILGAEERTSVVTLTDDDWADDETVRFADKLPFSDLYGSVLGSFPDPANLYQPTQYPRQVTSYLALPDGGEATAAQLDFPYEVHPRRVVRLASAWLARESLQPRLIGTFATRSLAWKLEPGDWFTMTSERLQIEDEKFEVVDIVKHGDFTVTLTARSINPNFLAFDNDNDPDLSVPPAVDPYDLLLDVPTFTAAASSVSASGATFPAIEFTLTSDETIGREIVVEYGKWVDPDIIGPTNVDSFHIDQIVTKLTKGVLPSTDYKVRAKVKAGLRESPWTAWSSAITIAAAFAVGTADEVPWSGVTDDGGRPDDNADVTSANTAAAITGQGGLATLGFVTIGTNLRLADGTTVATTGMVVTASGTAAAIAGQGSFATLSAINSTLADANNLLRRTAGGLFSGELNADLTSGHTAAAIASQGGLATLNFVTLNSNVRLQNGTTVASDAMLVTSSGTAAAISGQGGLATVNFVLFSSTVRLADGTTVVTDAMVVTASGTAGAISGQGALATLNSVGTSQIGANAVTNANIQETDTGINVGSSFVEVASVAITVPDSGTRVKIDWSAYIESSTDGSLMDAQIKRDGGVIWGPASIAGDPPTLDFETSETGPISYTPGFAGMVAGFDTDVPGSTGSKTYSLECRVAGSVSTPWVVSYRRLFVMLFNR